MLKVRAWDPTGVNLIAQKGYQRRLVRDLEDLVNLKDNTRIHFVKTSSRTLTRRCLGL
jgi:hypothetical protein